MTYQRIRAFLSVVLSLGMVLSSFMPLGCFTGARVRHGAERDVGQPYIPQTTAEQFKECGELVQDGLPAGAIPIDAQITADRNGYVMDATTKGEPNPEVGICLRLALREMRVDPEVIDRAKRRAISSSGPNVSTLPNRMHVGQVVEVVTVTVITVVYVEVFIEVSTVVLAVAITATVDLAVDAIVNASAAGRKPQQPVAKKWLEKGGAIQENADGSITYTRADGVAVTYDKEGYPDFTPYRHPTVKDVQIEFSGSYDKDFNLADTAAGITRQMRKDEKYTWHHHQDGKTMQLIKLDVHKGFVHTGGMAHARKENEECESTE